MNSIDNIVILCNLLPSYTLPKTELPIVFYSKINQGRRPQPNTYPWSNEESGPLNGILGGNSVGILEAWRAKLNKPSPDKDATQGAMFGSIDNTNSDVLVPLVNNLETPTVSDYTGLNGRKPETIELIGVMKEMISLALEGDGAAVNELLKLVDCVRGRLNGETLEGIDAANEENTEQKDDILEEEGTKRVDESEHLLSELNRNYHSTFCQKMGEACGKFLNPCCERNEAKVHLCCRRMDAKSSVKNWWKTKLDFGVCGPALDIEDCRRY